LRRVLFTEGDLVRKGQPLYRIDASPYEAQVANVQAALARARAAIASSVALVLRYCDRPDRVLRVLYKTDIKRGCPNI
jgi:membrane fusion protein, multidrug efflux system